MQYVLSVPQSMSSKAAAIKSNISNSGPSKFLSILLANILAWELNTLTKGFIIFALNVGWISFRCARHSFTANK